jgi:hypothetical protein
MSEKESVFIFQGESKVSRIIGIIGILVVIYLSITSILKMSLLGICIGVSLLLITYLFLHYKVILKVVFYDNHIIIKHLFKTKKIQLTSATKVYKNQEGTIPAYVYVLKYNSGKKERKITFYCKEDIFNEEVKPWLINKGIKITKRWK